MGDPPLHNPGPAPPGFAGPVADHALLIDSLGLIGASADAVVAAFFRRLFEDHPEIRVLFPMDEPGMATQRARFLKALLAIVTNYGDPERLRPGLAAIGARHASYGVRAEHYAEFGRIFIATLANAAGPDWTYSHEAAWQRMYRFVAGVMTRAGRNGPPGDSPSASAAAA